MSNSTSSHTGGRLWIPGPPDRYRIDVVRIAAADEAPAFLRIPITNDRGQATELDFASNADAQRFAERLILAPRDHRQP